MITTNIYKGFQIHIPKEIREKNNITEEDKITWRMDGENIILNVKKQGSLEDLIGLVKTDEEVDSVILKKQIQKGDI